MDIYIFCKSTQNKQYERISTIKNHLKLTPSLGFPPSMYLIHHSAIICVATYPSITYIFVADIFQTQKSEIWK